MLEILRERPKFVHNLLTSYVDEPDKTMLDIAGSTFEISTEDAETFLKFRRYCTGHNSVKKIAEKSGVDIETIKKMLETFDEMGLMRKNGFTLNDKSDQELLDTMMLACDLWSRQLSDTNIFDDILNNDETVNTFKGWLLETYHYVKAFPDSLAIAANHAQDPALKKLLQEYCKQEMGHESFVLNSLQKLGFSKEEVESSMPLVSTRLISLLINELVAFNPSAALYISKIIEASDFDVEDAKWFKQMISEKYNLPEDTLTPLFEHTRIDYELGHATLLDDNLNLLYFSNKEEASDILNKLHDIKHAFDAQKLEIKSYYNHVGNYIPRQKVDYYAI